MATITIGPGITMGPGITIGDRPETQQFLLVASGSMSVYSWSSTGFGSLIRILGSGVSTQSGGHNFAISPSGAAVVCSNDNFPYIQASTLAGTRYADPSSATPGATRNVAFSPSGKAVATVHSYASPYATAYAWNDATGFGTKYSSSPGGIPAAVFDLAFSPTGGAIAITCYDSPSVRVFAWSDVTGFGAQYADPSSLSLRTITSVTFNPTGNVIVLGDAYGRISAYAWSDATGFGARYTDPSSVPSQINSLQFNSAGNAIAAAHYYSPHVTVWAWNNNTGFGTKYADPSTPVSSTAVVSSGAAFNLTDDAIVVGFNVSPYIAAYAWSNATGFGTRYTDIRSQNSLSQIATSCRFLPANGGQ